MATAATPAPQAPATPSANGRYRTGDDIDPMKDERSGLIREVGCQAIWSLSSCKPGFGVDQLRDQSLENYWQSDGQLPHLVNIQFRRKMTIRDICIYTDFKLDESYTPSKISIRCGTHFNDLQEVELVEFSEPSGWVQIFLKDIRDRPIRTFMLQLAVLSNHQNGRDTHLRQIRIHSPVDNLPVAVFPDVSIWLHQIVKGFRDKDGNALPNAHLLGVFHRVCKLLNYGIKPIFVFDGGVPILKRQTLAARRKRKLESLDKAEQSRQRILSAYLQQQLQRQAKRVLPPSLRNALSANISSNKSPRVSPKKRKAGSANDGSQDDDIHEDLEAFRAALVAKLEDDVDEVNPQTSKALDSESDDDDDGPQTYRYGVDYSENFSVIQAPDFDTLPLETQHEILFEMQESRKMNSWGKFDKMPKDLQTFSNFQMDRLVKRRTLQKKIQSVQQEMGQRHIHVQNLDDLLKMDYGFEQKETKVVGSRDDGFVLIKSQEPIKGKKEDEPKPGTSKSTKQPEVITIDDFIEDNSSDEEGLSDANNKKAVADSQGSSQRKSERIRVDEDEEDEELKLAIQLSLMESGKAETTSSTSATSETDQTDSSRQGKKSEQSIQISSQPESVMHNKKSEEEVESREEKEREENNVLLNIQSSQISHCAKFLDTIGFHNIPSISTEKLIGKGSATANRDVLESREKISSNNSSISVLGEEEEKNVPSEAAESESEEDDDFEEVVEEGGEEIRGSELLSVPISATMGNSDTVATIDLSAIQNSTLNQTDDLFADVFANSGESVCEEAVGKSETKTMGDSEVGSAEMEHDIFMDNDCNPSSSAAVNKHSLQDAVTKWDSDSEIEADLMEMVLAESLAATNAKEKNSAESEEVRSSPQPLLPALSSSSKCDTTPTSKQLSEPKIISDIEPGSVKLITAEYMQAQERINSNLERLHSERGQQERVATSISDQMQIETQELISLFGIPYVISPTEAESQCAFLDRACLTEGSITDDSDVWVFGGQRVYKNFFSQGRKNVELYQAAEIQRVLNLNREKLIALAMMIGSDYSEGIQGVGPVLALEILSEFSSIELEGFDVLLKFHEWWEEIQAKPLDVFSGSKLKEKLRKLQLRPGFPSRAVYDAFVNPSIDTSTEAFKWGNPDLDAIRTYTKQKFGWEQSKCDAQLLPVLKNRQCEMEQSRQLTLDSYISFGKMPSLEKGKRKRGSKRIESAVKKLKRVVETESHELNLSSESDSDSAGEKNESSQSSSSKTPQRASKQVTTRAVEKGGKQSGTSSKKQKSENSRIRMPATAVSPTTSATPAVTLPESSSSCRKSIPQRAVPKPEVIPQRVQAESDKLKNKQKAIEVFQKRKGSRN